MANKISTAFVTDPSIQQPFTAKSLNFLQNRISEDIRGIVYNLIGENLYGYSSIAGVAVSGCDKSGGGNTIFNGWIYYAGELYYFPGAMGLLSYSNVPVVVLDETNDGAIDPVTFSDLIARSVHKIRRLKVVDQVSGTGLFDLDDLGKIVWEQAISGSNTTTAGAGLLAVTAATFTTPGRVMDIEIFGDTVMEFTEGSGISEGGVLFIRNVTTATSVSSRFATAQTSTAAVRQVPISTSWIQRSVPANTQFQLFIERAGGNNVTAYVPKLTVREIIRPALW